MQPVYLQSLRLCVKNNIRQEGVCTVSFNISVFLSAEEEVATRLDVCFFDIQGFV